jgi:small subunit ribosomal protein S12|uniref:Ribosomal protein S12 n=1 Tax=Emiliania huxleyi TaxID=2903 RepID=Q6VEC9_EMIHU|nr:ribosomal protein S12 [Emiliania huxleyi]UPY85206.1 ribosomal protein S12 [Gephyrocapsa muellerae]UPY85247.1 ribosomal protein S12 [Gephyrocapsa ericsonii]UPY85268.1 ribosomal protein S12 [Gephyrocapsa parvula]AAP94723.1 ribosomal protein S12 [Emiliania huxleyi]AEI29474.1 ribosomal protein S12 [Emiliania huxleyi]
MSRLLELLKKPRFKKSIASKAGKKLNSNPQRKVICLKVLTISPKKPNSANRRIAKVKTLKQPTFLTVKIPGEKHNLQQHSTVLICGGRSKDLIGVHLKAVRGKFDLLGVNGRKSSRSLYGVKSK